MNPEVIYLLKVNLGIALFYAFYKLFCCRDTFFVWRRVALLGFLSLSFLYPLLNIQGWVKEQPAMNELTNYYAMQMVTDDSAAAMPVQADALPVPDLLTVLLVVYLIGVAFFLLRFLSQLGGIGYMLWMSKPVKVDGFSVRSLSVPVNPFSFGRWIFLYLPDLQGRERMEVLTHEYTHVKQAHSIDVLLSELVNILCWMNPFSWLLKEEIRLNLEYLADRKVVEKSTDVRAYQYHLLGLANNRKQTSIYNNFNVSHLKNRIAMMNKKRTCTSGRIKYALFAPLTAALLLVSNVETVARNAVKLMKETSRTEVVENSVTMVETPEVVPQVPQKKAEPVVYQVCEEQAQYPGGMGECLKFLAANIKYPEKAAKEKKEGRVIVMFVVNADGSLGDFEIRRGVTPELDAEALRVAKLMPNWKPGKHQGKAVNSRFVLPVAFKL